MDKKVDIISLNRKAWNNVAEKYDNSKYDCNNPLVDYLLSELPEHASILDLGSGTGLPFAKLFVEKGFNYLGIDISSEMVRIAQKNVPLANFRLLSMTEIDFDNEFDAVFSSYTLLLLDPDLLSKTAKKIIRSLKEGGFLYISLNEPRFKDEDQDKNVICEIMGETMYSRAYTELELQNVFNPLNCVKIFREILCSQEFGVEHMLVMIFKKD